VAVPSGRLATATNKSLLVLFFRKELLSFHLPSSVSTQNRAVTVKNMLNG
jgi:hypothetical protein